MVRHCLEEPILGFRTEDISRLPPLLSEVEAGRQTIEETSVARAFHPASRHSLGVDLLQAPDAYGVADPRGDGVGTIQSGSSY